VTDRFGEALKDIPPARRFRVVVTKNTVPVGTNPEGGGEIGANRPDVDVAQ